ncbi:MAG: SDR family oxidoreductase, partial [Pseudomonadota bacterium]
MAQHPAIASGRTAVITGGASGVGLAAAEAFRRHGMNVVLADINGEALITESERLRQSGEGGVLAVEANVSSHEDLVRLRDQAFETFGDVAVLMNNAAIEVRTPALVASDDWRRTLDINLGAVIDGTQVFAPQMVAQNKPGAIINTGSKQGITCPPGNAGYNVAKAGVKAFTEQVAHELRETDGCQVTAHLLVPGFTFTGFTRVHTDTKPDGAWMPEQVIDYMLPRLADGDFYIICPDNDVTTELD